MLSGDEGGSNWLLPDVCVNVSRGDGSTNGVVKEVLLVCHVHLWLLQVHAEVVSPHVSLVLFFFLRC